MNTLQARILVVDDQPNNLLAVDAMLQDLGQEIIKAKSGFEALRRLLDDDYAVILLDVMMPEMDGYDTAKLIRERERSRHTPIIFLTAFNQNEANVFRGYSLGAVDFLFKPIIPEILRSKVKFFVELFGKNEELRRQTAEIMRLSRQNELILKSAGDGVLGISLSGTVGFVNPAAARMLGRNVDAMANKNVHDLLHPPKSCDQESCRLFNALRGRMLREVLEDKFWGADGSTLPVEYSVKPMKDADGELLGAVLTFRDVTERRAAAMARENERLYKEARAANEAKDDFLATLSHELRTPMTAILGWIDLLGMGDLDEQVRKEAIETIRTAARHQSQLIEDMLDVSRIVLGKFRVDMQPCDVHDVIKEVVDTVLPAAKGKGLHFEAKNIECEGVQVLGDVMRLKQAIWNLVSNAVKFTDEQGSVEVGVRCDQKDVEISVRDSGIGIEPEALPHIFDRLQQGETGKRYGGLGLGLAIVHHIVEAHGGTIDVRSDGIGKGSLFQIKLPVFKGAEAVRESEPSASPRGA
jgi:PAS domain S-box-containing protein